MARLAARQTRPLVVASALIVAASAFLPALRGQDGRAKAPAGVAKAPAAIGPVHRVGTDSCVARGCHGSVGAVDPDKGDYYRLGGEVTTWRTFDPHARAYRALLGERSVRMGKLLAARLENKPPHKAKLCLDCHSTTATTSPLDEGVNLTAGVDCEACHGPASAWLKPHVSASWPTQDKAKFGLKPIADMADRAKLCVGCHIGEPSRQVDHDLIAAGHPRMSFELDSFLDAYPKHWIEPHEKPNGPPSKDFHAKAWAIGQVVGAEAVLDLLASRADGAVKETMPWPEFSESDCFSCHHTIAKDPWRAPAGGDRKAGQPGWGGWNISGVLALAKGDPASTLAGPESPLPRLRAEMAETVPDPAKVAGLAKVAAESLRAWRAGPKGIALDAAGIDALLGAALAPEGRPSLWDERASRLLSAEALSRAKGGALDPATAKQIEALDASLRFPDGFDSPRLRRP